MVLLVAATRRNRRRRINREAPILASAKSQRSEKKNKQREKREIERNLRSEGKKILRVAGKNEQKKRKRVSTSCSVLFVYSVCLRRGYGIRFVKCEPLDDNRSRNERLRSANVFSVVFAFVLLHHRLVSNFRDRMTVTS